MMQMVVVVFFLFKQKTAYEMRISDWSSDVCSSDLMVVGHPQPELGRRHGMTAVEDEVRRIEADAAPTRFARGWHCLGLAKDFQDGKPHQVNAFAQNLVVF